MLSSDLLPFLPDAARIWVHPTTAPLSDETQAAIRDRLGAFVEEWSSHEKDVEGGAAVLYDRFVLLAGARTDGNDPSGCAIDDAARAVDAVADEFGIEWVPSLHVLYRAQEGDVVVVSRSTFQERAEAGTITTTTTVFDPSVTTLGAVREGDFEQPAGQSWHADVFSLSEPV